MCQENRKELRGPESRRAKGGENFENQGVVGGDKCIREAKKAKNCSEAIAFVLGELNDNLQDSYFSRVLKTENSTAGWGISGKLGRESKPLSTRMVWGKEGLAW